MLCWRIVRRRLLYLWVVLVFGGSEMLASVLGVRFADETLGTLYQYLDPAVLRGDLLRGLYYLHSQPPFFNLFLGVVLKLYPRASASAFSAIFGALALGLLLGLAWMLRRLGVRDRVTGVVVLLFALSPNFIVYRHWLFYTLPVAALLVAGAVALDRFRATAGLLPLSFFLLAGLSLMMTRSVFHPLFWILLVGTLAPLLPPGRQRRRLLAGALVPLLLVHLWFWKNEEIVSSYAGSTWLGMSLAKRWPLSHEEMARLEASGAIPPFWHRRSFQTPRELAPFGFFRGTPHPVHPAIDAPYKTNGEPNFNHRDYVAISEAMLAGDLYLIRHFPGRYAQRVATATLLYLQPGPNSVHFLVDYEFDRVHAYRDWVTRYLFLGGEITRPIRMLEPPGNLLLALFPVLVALGGLRLYRGRASERPLLAYLLLSVLFVTAVANLVEIGENDRMRWEVEPFLAVWLGLLVDGAARALRRLSSSWAAGRA